MYSDLQDVMYKLKLTGSINKMHHLLLQQNLISMENGNRCLLEKQLIHHIWTLVILLEKVYLQSCSLLTTKAYSVMICCFI